MRSQDEFVAARRATWNELEALLARSKELHREAPESISRVASLYRSVCADLMRSRSAYGPDLVAYLDGLAGRAHNVLYGARPYRLGAFWELIARDFPRTLRRRWRFFAAAFALFTIPFVIGMLGTLYFDGFAEEILPGAQLGAMADMYAEGFNDGRDARQDAHMMGFYVLNNVGIAFRCFATGILFGLGSIFFLVYNGIVTGTVVGYVILSGGGRNILTFVCGHSPFELTAIIIAGGAGLQMGYSLVHTKGRTRIGSLRAQAPELFHLIVGAALMLGIAAIIEGFWSPSAMPPPVKWGASLLFSTLVASYLLFAGRGSKSRAAVDVSKLQASSAALSGLHARPPGATASSSAMSLRPPGASASSSAMTLRGGTR
jgi:uncharacterized membrane protein SpoIIM required for sporulation